MIEDYNNSEIVKSLNEKIFKEKSAEIWRYAADEIHPFQKGDSHQSSQHCCNVLNNLSHLMIFCEFTDLEKYLLCCSAILHDLDKAVIEYDLKVGRRKLHGVISSEFIRKHSELFNFNEDEAMAVATIVEHHGHKGLKEIVDKHKPKHIKIDGAKKEYPRVIFSKLASVFKLADIMDVTYKRVSKPIIYLNYGPEPTDSKIRARSTLRNVEINNSLIVLNTWPGDLSPEKYQSVIIAIDMMNEELTRSGAKDFLKIFNFPYKFELGDCSLNKGATKLKEQREKISEFDKEFRLVLCNKNEEDIKKVYDANSKIIEFSSSEVEQLKETCRPVYLKAKKKSIGDVSREFRKLFGFSIDKLKVTREYLDKGRVYGLHEYKGLRKPKMLNIIISYDIIELSAKADYNIKYSKIFEPPQGGNVEKIERNHIRLIWPDTVGYDKVNSFKGSYMVNGAWCKRKRQIRAYYPGDQSPYEDYTFKTSYPICEVEIYLKFPIGYNVQPFCEYSLGNKSKMIKIYPQYDSGNNSFSFVNFHIPDWTLDKSPIYSLRWKVPK